MIKYQKPWELLEEGHRGRKGQGAASFCWRILHRGTGIWKGSWKIVGKTWCWFRAKLRQRSECEERHRRKDSPSAKHVWWNPLAALGSSSGAAEKCNVFWDEKVPVSSRLCDSWDVCEQVTLSSPSFPDCKIGIIHNCYREKRLIDAC